MWRQENAHDLGDDAIHVLLWFVVGERRRDPLRRRVVHEDQKGTGISGYHQIRP
jgi:hypothetical protein